MEQITPEIKARVWRQVVGFPKYKVSDFGEVKNNKGYMLTLQKSLSNRISVTLSDNGKPKRMLVHRLVGMAFIPNPDGKPQINHIDGNPSNNHASNLEWCTGKENVRHAWETGLCKPRKLPDHEIRAIKELNSVPVYLKNIKTGNVLRFDSFTDAANWVGVNQAAISMALSRKSKCKGYLVSTSNSFEQTDASKRYGRSVICISPNGEQVVYKSSNEAGKTLGLDPAFIRKVCKGIYSQYKGYRFRYSVDELVEAGVFKLKEVNND